MLELEWEQLQGQQFCHAGHRTLIIEVLGDIYLFHFSKKYFKKGSHCKSFNDLPCE